MKRLLAILLVLMMSITFACSATADQARVMTSFYPLYIFALNVFDGIDGITVECMTAPQTGCLHDYQLLVSDMMKLAESDLFVVCGAGMETYLDDVTQQFSQLPVLDCSVGLQLLDDCGEGEAHDGHDHSVNPHTWLNIDNAILIVKAIGESGCAHFPAYAEQIQANADTYLARLTLLKEELSASLAHVRGRQTITFHEGFSYFAQAYGIEVLSTIFHDTENGLHPAQIAQVIRYVEQTEVSALFSDVNGASSAADAVAKETGSQVYAFNPIVSGEISLTAYEDGMRMNAKQVQAAFE